MAMMCFAMTMYAEGGSSMDNGIAIIVYRALFAPSRCGERICMLVRR